MATVWKPNSRMRKKSQTNVKTHTPAVKLLCVSWFIPPCPVNELTISPDKPVDRALQSPKPNRLTLCLIDSNKETLKKKKRKFHPVNSKKC